MIKKFFSFIFNRPMKLQVGCICYKKEKKKLKILIITSRNSKRWIIPKGWIKKNLGSIRSAEAEAWEEAGVKGKCYKNTIGFYTYQKIGKNGKGRRCTVKVFALKVREQLNDFPEKNFRTLRWITPEKSHKFIENKELVQVLENFAKMKSKASK